MSRRIVIGVLAAAAAVAAFAGGAADELSAVEAAFAATMAERDLEAFAGFLDPEVVFFTGDRVLRGHEAVTQAWAPYFDGAEAPFAWAPEAVEVLDSGGLGFSSGPVLAPDGRRIGTFNSVWRRTTAGWRIVFDRGCPPCGGAADGGGGA
jgi:ketosteroid isomerase-like protein